jgi:hypothetical protein
MKKIDLTLTEAYVNSHITTFHQSRIRLLGELTLQKLLQKNPYLFRAKNLLTAQELVLSLLDAFLSSSEEKLFGDFLEGLAIHVASQTVDGRKSASPGIDLEFEREGTIHLVSIKSGANWGNSSQYTALKGYFQKAVTRLKQSQVTIHVQPVLGICYGKTRTSHLNGYLKVVGQSFWYLLSNDSELYKKIIEPIGYNANLHNQAFEYEKAAVVNRVCHEFIEDFCFSSGKIDWNKLVEHNSKNMAK